MKTKSRTSPAVTLAMSHSATRLSFPKSRSRGSTLNGSQQFYYWVNKNHQDPWLSVPTLRWVCLFRYGVEDLPIERKPFHQEPRLHIFRDFFMGDLLKGGERLEKTTLSQYVNWVECQGKLTHRRLLNRDSLPDWGRPNPQDLGSGRITPELRLASKYSKIGRFNTGPNEREIRSARWSANYV